MGEAGRFEEALKHGREAVQLDPLSPVAQTTVGQAYYLSQNFEAATREYRRLVALNPVDPSSHFFLAWSLEQGGEFELAIESHQRALELSDNAALYLAGLGFSYALAGRLDEAREILEELQSDGRADPFHVALLKTGLGDYGGAIDSLEEAYELRISHMLYIKQGAQFDALRGDERFTRLVQRMGW
jgi:Flp pilus assembly protein TadD